MYYFTIYQYHKIYNYLNYNKYKNKIIIMSNKVKINVPNYIDASISTLIKDIPHIITNNNSESLTFFNAIFNFGDYSSNTASRQYIKTSVDTDGYVKANSGEFNNIKFNNIDTSTAKNAFISNVKVNHNNAINRFKVGAEFVDSSIIGIEDYCHNTESIYHTDASGGTSLNNIIFNLKTSVNSQNNSLSQLTDKVNNLELLIDKLYENLNINRTYSANTTYITNSYSSNDLYNSNIVEAYNNSTNSYTYPVKVYSGDTNVKYQTSYDHIDINNNIKFRYYNVNSIYTKVNNQFMNSLNCNEVSLQTNIIIDKTHNNDLIIKLYYDGNEYTCVKVLNTDIELCRLLLTCIEINEYGPKWYITSYSGNIEIIKIKNN